MKSPPDVAVHDFQLRNSGKKGIWDPFTDTATYNENTWFPDSPSEALIVNEGVPTIVSLEV